MDVLEKLDFCQSLTPATSLFIGRPLIRPPTRPPTRLPVCDVNPPISDM